MKNAKMWENWNKLLDIWDSDEYINRVHQLEDEGFTTSDAQGKADIEFNCIMSIK